MKIPRRDILFAPVGPSGENVVQGNDQCVYYSRLIPGKGYEWTMIKDISNSHRNISVGPGREYEDIKSALRDNDKKYESLVLEIDNGEYDQEGDFSLETQTNITIKSNDFPLAGVSFVSGACISIGEIFNPIILRGKDNTVFVDCEKEIDFPSLGLKKGDSIFVWAGRANAVMSMLVVETEKNSITASGKFPLHISLNGNGFVVKPRVTLSNISESGLIPREYTSLKFKGIHFGMGKREKITFPVGDNINPSTLSMENCLLEGGLNVTNGSSLEMKNVSLLSNSHCLLCGPNVNILGKNLSLVQTGSEIGFMTYFLSNVRAYLDNCNMSTVNRNFMVESSNISVGSLSLFSKGSVVGSLLDVRKGSIFSGTVNKIAATSKGAIKVSHSNMDLEFGHYSSKNAVMECRNGGIIFLRGGIIASPSILTEANMGQIILEETEMTQEKVLHLPKINAC